MTDNFRILCLDDPSREAHYHSIRAAMPESTWHFAQSDHSSLSLLNYDIALVTDEFCDLWALRVRSAAGESIPVLHLVDGILEWRNTWENPRSHGPGMPLFQPVLSHKIACLGRSQARILESWGNIGKCEIVGLPRLDSLANAPPSQRNSGVILVITARTPAFTPKQLAATKDSLNDLNDWFKSQKPPLSISLRPRWRISPHLADEMGIPLSDRDSADRPLAESLTNADAVITTPSTAILEGMLRAIPVAILNYHNRPSYVPAAWEITAKCHIDPIMTELASPPAPLMIYQDTILHDALECKTSATLRAVQLIKTMASIGREARANRQPLRFPNRILSDEQFGHHLPEAKFDLTSLYPNHPVFGSFDRTAIQAELGHARAEICRQQAELASYSRRMNDFRFYEQLESLPLFGRLIYSSRRLLERLARTTVRRQQTAK